MAQRKVTMTLEGVDALKAAVTRAPAVLKAHVGSANHTTAHPGDWPASRT
jgi:hypothetical protein